MEKYRNVLVSDLGMIAKLGQDNTLTVAITDVNSGAPKYGIEIVAMDYQQNLISQGRTIDQGMVQLEVDRRPTLWWPKKAATTTTCAWMTAKASPPAISTPVASASKKASRALFTVSAAFGDKRIRFTDLCAL